MGPFQLYLLRLRIHAVDKSGHGMEAGEGWSIQKEPDFVFKDSSSQDTFVILVVGVNVISLEGLP